LTQHVLVTFITCGSNAAQDARHVAHIHPAHTVQPTRVTAPSSLLRWVSGLFYPPQHSRHAHVLASRTSSPCSKARRTDRAHPLPCLGQIACQRQRGFAFTRQNASINCVSASSPVPAVIRRRQSCVEFGIDKRHARPASGTAQADLHAMLRRIPAPALRVLLSQSPAVVGIAITAPPAGKRFTLANDSMVIERITFVVSRHGNGP